MNKYMQEARAMRASIDSITADMPDEKAIENTVLFKQWNGNGVNYTAGERISYNGVLYSVLHSHTSQPDWNPEVAVSLFAKVLAPDPDKPQPWEKPDSTNPYNKGDKVIWTDGEIYESLIDGNVWSPEEYPAGWKKVES